ncbi:acyl-CoA:6-aminopenicillanic acid acyl transferase [Gillisia mitskevichiae]|uniref:Acyl-CoA:6-aminopenicillanic acid acyl transferase n=1 Tax=Gillisia mitskevichiae TaxID=270921 RepID=A0A495PR76_9FLAO|nr:C45 family autoproteolytic acyltransferase/hydolase [Gillisia mitskevichiae]RKS53144.1 acyl-CoA:6-aminopenicillanic acid acyl transferase [Gillisia mitskevichiae]
MKLYIIRLGAVLFMILLQVSCGINRSMQKIPDISGIEKIDTLRTKHNDSLYSIGKNTLLKNKYGIWELYLEGDALERGIVNGSLTRELMHKQESAFMTKIETLVPSVGYQNFLSKMIGWFNRKIYLYVPEEYKKEIYGVSRFALPKYDSFAPAYVRMLYLHGAHDIGHALQDLMLVGCTSFAAWDLKTEDGKLLVGRNFDFYAGDEFAEEKMVAFVNPTEGHKFMMYTWGGMIGVVSGMNDKGLTVTINAGKSMIPLIAKTPISLVAREILQYAENTEEAIAIARKREVFVSESIMIGSAAENKAILIEVSPNNFGVYEVPNSDQLICSNHFQSEAYQDDRRNSEAILESHSQYRYDRMKELVATNNSLDPKKAASILRNKEGLKGVDLGLGNEKAINQLLAHHGIIFKPEERKVWVSANPYQLGAFIAYDLEEAFEIFEKGSNYKSVLNASETIPADDFIYTKKFKDYEDFRVLYKKLHQQITDEEPIKTEDLDSLIQLNINYWKTYALAGEYYFQKKEFKKAIIYFKQAKRREVTTLPDLDYLDKMIAKSYRKL